MNDQSIGIFHVIDRDRQPIITKGLRFFGDSASEVEAKAAEWLRDSCWPRRSPGCQIVLRHYI